MSVEKRTLFWVAVVALFMLFLWRLGEILLPFIMGMAIAYFLDPAVDWLERHRVGRTLGTVIVMLLFVCGLAVLLLLVMPLFQGQVLDLVKRLPDMVTNLRTRVDVLAAKIQLDAGVPLDQISSIREAAGSQATKALEWAGTVIGGLVTGGIALVNLLSLLFITPIVAFYLLRDWDSMIVRIDSWLPRSSVDAIRAQAREIDRTLSGFARGQALVCISLGLFYAIGLSLSGLDFGLIIGAFSGLVSFIPYVGALSGGLISIGLALLQFPEWTPVLIVAGIYVAGQVLEGNVLQPWFVGDRVGLHPVWVIFALLAGGVLFGFVGLLLAIPITAMIGVLARFALGRYLDSPLYQDRPEPRPAVATDVPAVDREPLA